VRPNSPTDDAFNRVRCKQAALRLRRVSVGLGAYTIPALYRAVRGCVRARPADYVGFRRAATYLYAKPLHPVAPHCCTPDAAVLASRGGVHVAQQVVLRILGTSLYASAVRNG
jgi:hypothetical protein